jgi:integrase
VLIRIEEGKGRKDRNAMLSPQLLGLPRLWWGEGKRRSVLLPHDWLFPPFARPDTVLAYLSRYTHRVAISNSRLLRFDQTGVTFRYKDYRRVVLTGSRS